MKLYIGAAFHGQDELARQENPGVPVLTGFHLVIRKLVEEGGDAAAYARSLIETQSELVVSGDEIGAGVVPLNGVDRAWREGYGRAMCLLAQHSQTVTRVVCGIGVRIK